MHKRPTSMACSLARLGLGLATVALASASWAQAQNNNRSQGDAPAHAPMQQERQQSGSAGTASGPDGAARPAGQRNGAQLAEADREFMQQAAQNNHAELAASRTALERSKNEQVRKFAQHMVDEHTKAGQEMAQLASKKGLELPDGPSVMQKGKHGLLMATTGETFDRRYSDTMGREAHRQNIELFEKASREAQDAEVKAFATKSLPMLRKHLEMAQSLPTGDEDKAAARQGGTGAGTAAGSGAGTGSGTGMGTAPGSAGAAGGGAAQPPR